MVDKSKVKGIETFAKMTWRRADLKLGAVSVD
jgi:hypothetical protein